MSVASRRDGLAAQVFDAALRGIVLACVLSALSATAVAAWALRQQERSALGQVADLAVIQAQPVLMFEDEFSARELVMTLTGTGLVQRSELRLTSGKVLAAHAGSSETGWLARLWPAPILEREVEVDGRRFGQIVLQGSGQSLRQALSRLSWAQLAAALISVFLALAMARWRSQRIAAPLETLRLALDSPRDAGGHGGPLPSVPLGELDLLQRRYNDLLAELARCERERGDAEATLDQLRDADDAVTGLPGRASFERQRLAALRAARRNPEARLGMLYLDVDHFAGIVSSRGRPAADQLLREIAARLIRWLPAGAVAARRGGDEFFVLLRHPPPAETLDESVRALRRSLETPVALPDGAMALRVNLGWAVYPDTVDTLDALAVHADDAMYANKAHHSIHLPTSGAP